MFCRTTQYGRWRLRIISSLATCWLCGLSNAVAEPIALAGRLVTLGAKATSVTLLPSANVQLDGVFREAEKRRFTLSLTGITASRSPDVSYLVFLNVQDGSELTVDNPGYAGSLAFFGGAKAGARFRFPPVSFEISDVLVRLHRAKRSSLPLIVTFKPTDARAADSAPSIETIGVFAF
jgi:hypothetical protein